MLRSTPFIEMKRPGRVAETNEIRALVEELLSSTGIAINGNQPWDIKVTNESFYNRVLRDGNLGLGESYMDKWWDSERLDELFYRLIPADPEKKIRRSWKLLFHALKGIVTNCGSKSRAFQIGKPHYDLGNELYGKMLDRRMVYSCAYWKDANNLDDAQEAKLDLIVKSWTCTRGAGYWTSDADGEVSRATQRNNTALKSSA